MRPDGRIAALHMLGQGDFDRWRSVGGLAPALQCQTHRVRVRHLTGQSLLDARPQLARAVAIEQTQQRRRDRPQIRSPASSLDKQLPALRNRPRQPVGPPVQTGLMLLFDQGREMRRLLDALPPVVAAPVCRQHRLAIDDTHPERVGDHRQGLLYVLRRHRIVVQVEAHIGRLADLHRHLFIGRIRMLRQRQKMCRFQGEGFAHAQGRVLGATPVSRLSRTPGLGLRIEVRQIEEGATGEEGFANIANGPFHAPLLIPSRDRHRARLVAIMAGELQQGGIEADRLPLSLEDGALQVVVQQHSRQAPPGAKRPDMAAQEVLHARIEKEAQVDHARPRQHHHESHQCPAGAADFQVAEVPPIDLGLFAG